MNKHLLVAGIPLLILVISLSGCYDYDINSNSHISGEENIIIKDYSIDIDHVGIDELYIDNIEVLVKNEGDTSTRIDQIVLSSGESEIDIILFLQTIDPGEEKYVSGTPLESLEKEIGINQFEGKISLTQYSGKVLAEKNIIIPIPIARVGDTIPEVGMDKHNLSLTILSWKESDIALDGPYTGAEYYTFSARAGFKFIVMTFEFKNNWIREQTTPYFNSGEVATDKGYIYSIWNWLDNYEEYESRKATEEEINTLIGNSAGYESLLPEESVKGCIVFEIPEDETALEISINGVPPIIKLE